jgi:hypothetical protein
MIVDAYAVLTGSISHQFLQTVARWRFQVFEYCCRLKHRKLSRCGLADRSEPLRPLSLEQLLGIPTLEALNRHRDKLIPFTGKRQRYRVCIVSLSRRIEALGCASARNANI